MASVFGHAALALGIRSWFPRSQGLGIILLGVILSFLPDADIIAFDFGIPYGHVLGHRGLSHSIFFALVFTYLFTWILRRFEVIKPQYFTITFIYFFICMGTHGILDAMTTGGKGVAFFAPFYNERMFWPWRVIQVSPIGAGHFFSKWGVAVIKSEAFWIGIPSLIIYVLGFVFRKFRSTSQ